MSARPPRVLRNGLSRSRSGPTRPLASTTSQPAACRGSAPWAIPILADAAIVEGSRAMGWIIVGMIVALPGCVGKKFAEPRVVHVEVPVQGDGAG